MFKSFFESPEISEIFKRKEGDKKIKTKINKKYDRECAECLRVQKCKQSRKRDRTAKKARSHYKNVAEVKFTKTQTQNKSSITRLNQQKSKMEDIDKLAMMNEDNVYYDFDEEKGVVVEKKHSVVHVSKSATSNNRGSNKLDAILRSEIPEIRAEMRENTIPGDYHASSLSHSTKVSTSRRKHAYASSFDSSPLKQTPPDLYQDTSEEQYIDGHCVVDTALNHHINKPSSPASNNHSINNGSCKQNSLSRKKAAAILPTEIAEEQSNNSSRPSIYAIKTKSHFNASSHNASKTPSSDVYNENYKFGALKFNNLEASLTEALPDLCSELSEETFLDGSCPSDSAYETTHDDLSESFERLTTSPEKPTQESASSFGEMFKFQPKSSVKESPYRRCRSTAVCGRNCALCRGSNTNVIKPRSRGVGEILDDDEVQTNRSKCSGIGEFIHDVDTILSRKKWKFNNPEDASQVHDANGISVDGNTSLEFDIKLRPKELNLKDSQYNEPWVDGKPTEVGQNRLDTSPTSRKMSTTNDTLPDDTQDLHTYDLDELEEIFSSGPHITMLYDFKAEQEDDVTALKGDVLLLLDDGEKDWVWVMTQDFEEGYVPRSLTGQHLDCEECAREELLLVKAPTSKSTLSSASSSVSDTRESLHVQHGIKMIAISSFEATEKGKLCLTKGEEMVIDMREQRVPEWLWAYSPRQKAYGYVPEHLVDALEVSSV